MRLKRMWVRMFSPSFKFTFLLTAALAYAATSAFAASPAAVSPAQDILIEPVTTDGLLEEEGDYIIITHPDFIGPLGGYINHRAADGFTVRAVTTTQIYNVFPPVAGEEHLSIKSYLAYAYFFWTLKPKYVAIFGDGSKYESSINKVPYFYYEAHEYGYLWENNGYVDDWFVDFTGNDLVPEIPIGRIPVRTVGDVYNYISKVVSYESNLHPSWEDKTFVCINDEDGPMGATPPYDEYLNQLYGAAQEINDVLAFSKNTEEIKASDYTVPGAWLEFKDRFETGSALGVFLGFAWRGKLGYFVNDPPRTGYVVDINNQGKYNIFMANGCELRGSSSSIAYQLTAFGNRGSVACLLPSDNLNKPAYSYIPFKYFCRCFVMAGNMRLGDAWRSSKIAGLNSEAAPACFFHVFQLAGDPALKIIGEGSYFPYLLSGWPQLTGYHTAEPVACADFTPAQGVIPDDDLDGPIVPEPAGAGPQDVVTTAWNRAFAWRSGGQEIYDFTLSSNDTYGCLADIDANGTLDYVSIRGGKVTVYDKDADPVENFPVEIPDLQDYAPAVGDMNGDGYLDVLCIGGFGSSLYAVDRTGQVLQGWPKSEPGCYFWNTPSIGDVDADGELEAVVTYGGDGGYGKLIIVSDSNGVEETLTFGGSIDPRRAVLAEIDGDADLEIVVACRKVVVDADIDNLFVLDRVGGQYAVLWKANAGGDIEFPPCVGDFRWANPGKEIMLVREGPQGQNPGHLTAYDARTGGGLADRVLDWAPTSAPTVADIVDQHGLEVLFGMPDELAAYNVCYDMPKVQNWNAPLNTSVTTPLVTDLDGNGSCDIVCSDADAVYAFTTNAPYGGLENFDWVRDGHDNLNMGLWDITAPTGVRVEDKSNDQGGTLILSWTPSVDDGVRSNRVAEYWIYRTAGEAVPPGDGGFPVDRALRKKLAEGRRAAASWGDVRVMPTSLGEDGAPVPSTSGNLTDADVFLRIATVLPKTYYYLDEGLENGKLYKYYVIAIDGTHKSQPSVIVSAVPHDNIAPAPPTNFDLEIIWADPPIVRLMWTRSVDDPLYQEGQPGDSAGEKARPLPFGTPRGTASPLAPAAAGIFGPGSDAASAGASDAGGSGGVAAYAPTGGGGKAFPLSEKEGEAFKAKVGEGRRNVETYYSTTAPRLWTGRDAGLDAGANDVETYVITKCVSGGYPELIYFYPYTAGNDVEYWDYDVSYGKIYYYTLYAWDGENPSEEVGPLVANLAHPPPPGGDSLAFLPPGISGGGAYAPYGGDAFAAAGLVDSAWGASRTKPAKVVTCKPNPVTGTATFTITLPTSTQVRLDVYDLCGRKVDTVLAKRLEAGGESVVWQPRVANGVYIYKLETPSKQYGGKVVVAR